MVSEGKESTARVLNQMPVGGGAGLEGARAAFQREYEAMFDVSYEEDPPVTGPDGSKYAGQRLGQLRHMLRRRDCGKVELKEVDETLAAMGADGADNPDVLEATSKVLTGLLAHMNQVKGGMDSSRMLGRLSPLEREMVLKGGSKHPGRDGVRSVHAVLRWGARGVFRVLGGDWCDVWGAGKEDVRGVDVSCPQAHRRSPAFDMPE